MKEMPGYREVWRDFKELLHERKKIFPYGFRHPREWDYTDWGSVILRSISLYILVLMG